MYLGWLGSLDIYISEGFLFLGWSLIGRPASLCLFFLQFPHEVKEIFDRLGRALDVQYETRPVDPDGFLKRSGTLDDLPILHTDSRWVVKQLVGTDRQISLFQ